MNLFVKAATVAALVALLPLVGCSGDKPGKDGKDKPNTPSSNKPTDKPEGASGGSVIAQLKEARQKLEAEIKPIEDKVAALKTDAEKAAADKKEAADKKYKEAKDVLADIKLKMEDLVGVREAGGIKPVMDKVMAVIADAKKKLGL